MSATMAPVRRSGWRSMLRAAVLLLWQAGPWVLVVLVVMVVLGTGNAAWGIWSAGRSGGTLIVQGDQGVADGVSVLVGLAALLSWMRTVRTALPVLVAGGITRRAATGGLLVAAVALAVATTAMLALAAVAGAALLRALAAGVASVVTPSGGEAHTSTLTLTTDAPEVYFNPAETLPWFVLAALVGALLSAAWYRWHAFGVVGVLVALGVPWSAYAAVITGSSVATSNAVSSAAGAPFVDVASCLVLAAAVWLVLRRVLLRPPAR